MEQDHVQEIARENQEELVTNNIVFHPTGTTSLPFSSLNNSLQFRHVSLFVSMSGSEPVVMESVISTISFSKLDGSPLVIFDTSVSSQDPIEKGHYNLHPWEKKDTPLEVIGGLGAPHAPPLNRKTNLAKAQHRAKLDIVDGKQLSLTWALRATQASGRVPK